MGLAGKLGVAVLALALAGGAAAWALSAPRRLDDTTLAAMGPGDAARGERIFNAGGCTSCHARPGAEGDARRELAGGLKLKTPFGTFVPPNISSDPDDGIGALVARATSPTPCCAASPLPAPTIYPAFPYPPMHG